MDDKIMCMVKDTELQAVHTQKKPQFWTNRWSKCNHREVADIQRTCKRKLAYFPHCFLAVLSSHLVYTLTAKWDSTATERKSGTNQHDLLSMILWYVRFQGKAPQSVICQRIRSSAAHLNWNTNTRTWLDKWVSEWWQHFFCSASENLTVCAWGDVLCKVCTAVGVALFSGASNLIAVLVHTPALAGVAVTLGWFVVAFIGATRDVGAWRQEGEMGKLK